MAAGERSDLLLLLPEPVRELPADLAAVAGFVLVACLFVLVPGLNETPLRVVFGLPLVLFLPGYALVAALFPEAGESPTAETPDSSAAETDDTADSLAADAETATGADDEEDGVIPSLAGGTGDRGIDGIERVALSFGLSIAVVPLLGLILNFTPWGIRLVPILVAVTGFTLGLTAVAAVRRRSIPETERFRVPYRNWIDSGRAELFEPESRLDGALNILLVCSILLAVGSVAYAVAVPPDGEQFSEFYLLGEDDEGELVAANYPTEFTAGTSQSVVVGIGNQESTDVEYTVVVQLQNVTAEGNESVVLERQELDRFSSPVIGDNETWQREHAIQPTMVGEELRLQYLLYRGSPPAEPTVENAYRDVHLWINATAGG